MHEQAPQPFFEVFHDRSGRGEKSSFRQLSCYLLDSRWNKQLVQEKDTMGMTYFPLSD